MFLWPCAYYYYFLRLKFLTTKFLTCDAVCTISSYVVFQNIVIIGVLTVDLLSPSQLMSVHVCKGLEFRVGYEAFYGNDHGKRKHIHH